MAFAILRTAKLKAGNLHGSSSHVTRSRETPNADPAKRHLNRILIGSGVSPVEAIKRRVDEVTRARKSAGSRKLRSDSVLAVEYILTASPEHWAEKTQEEAEAWAHHSVAFIKQRFGAANVVSATLHMDEQSPHLHVYHVPEAKDPKNRPTLSAKQYYGTRELLSALQSDYAEHMQRFDPTLKRGLKNSRARHKPVQTWYAEIERGIKIKAPGLNGLKVPMPPRMVREEARREWADRQSESLAQRFKERLGTVLRRFSAVMRAARHYKSLYETERKRNAAYRAQVENPSQIREWKAAAREAVITAREAADRALQAERQLGQLTTQVGDLQTQSALHQRRLMALCDALDIHPTDAEKMAPAARRAMDNYREEIRGCAGPTLS